jgi:hypothetical protein
MTPGRAHVRRASRRSSGRFALALGLALSTAAGGCSFQWMKLAPPHGDWPDPVLPSSSQQRCTDSIGLPIADTVVGAAMGSIGFIERNALTGGFVLKPPAGQVVAAGQTVLVHERVVSVGFAPDQSDLVPKPDEVSRGIAIGLGIGAIAFLASAVYGYVQTGLCRHYTSIFQSQP